jgi:hypothetical protein
VDVEAADEAIVAVGAFEVELDLALGITVMII